jgi:hypothetical protein
MRTAKILFTTMFCLILIQNIQAKKDEKSENTKWDNVDFIDKYKGKIKVSGAAKKALSKNPVFVRDYTISNAMAMKGSESNAKGTVHSEVFFGGIPKDSFQKMVEELYAQFETEISGAGLNVVNGDELLQSAWAVKKAGDKDSWVGKTGNDPIDVKGKTMDGGVIQGFGVWGVREAVYFRPADKNVYMTNKKVFGTFYQNLSVQNDVSLIAVYYNITFASFDGGRGYSSAVLETKPNLTIQPTVVIDGVTISFGDLPIWGNNDWSLGIAETDLDKLEYFGLTTSAEYAIKADPEKYIAEVKAIISNFQTDLIQALKAEL